MLQIFIKMHCTLVTIWSFLLIESSPRLMTHVCRALDTFVFGPVYWLREKVVEPLKGESYPWYHRRYPRVPSIDECYTDDLVCRWLA